MTLRPTALALLLALPCLAQTPKVATVPTPVYDIVSITPNKAGANSTSWRFGDSDFTGSNVNAMMLVSFAYDLRSDLISGLPGWTSSTPFDITAKIVDPDLPTLKKLTDKQHNQMLVQVLADRFHLQAHTETRQLPVYNLVLLPHGPRFKASALQQENKGSWFNNTGEFTGTTIRVSALADFLASQLHRTVIDQTGLPALYDLHLTWAPDRPAATAGLDTGQRPGQATGSTDDTGPSLFSALVDQLGLKLVPAKGPVTTLVVDHIEPPTPN